MIIIHGNNLVASRDRLHFYLTNFKGEILKIDGSQINLTDLKQACESLSIFNQPKLIVIENLFRRRPSQTKETIFKYLKLNLFENLLIWEDKKIDGRVILPFNKAKIELFEIGKIIWRFLDSLSPHNQKNTLSLFHQCLTQEGPELIFYLLEKQIRSLLIAQDLKEKGLSQMAPWQKTKIIRQANKFNQPVLINLYRKLLEIEYQQKTGQSPFPLVSHLDLWLASL